MGASVTPLGSSRKIVDLINYMPYIARHGPVVVALDAAGRPQTQNIQEQA